LFGLEGFRLLGNNEQPPMQPLCGPYDYHWRLECRGDGVLRSRD
jgi:hypothetical protein